jgi:hypothetical protein
MLNLPVPAREASQGPRIPFTGDETWSYRKTQKLSNICLTERAYHLHAQTRQVCSNVKSMPTLLTFIDLCFINLFHKGKLKPPLLHICGKMCCEGDLRIGIQGDCLLHYDNTAFLCMNFWPKKIMIIISYSLC